MKNEAVSKADVWEQVDAIELYYLVCYHLIIEQVTSDIKKW